MRKSNFIFIFLSIIISSVGLFSLLQPGFFLTDDGNSMVIRFSAFYEALRSGQFPVRFLHRLNYGFGYPVADFLYPLFMYLGIPIKALGFSFVDTIKIIFALGFLWGTTFSYLWLKKMFDQKSAMVGAIVYSLFPYHLFDLYKRGSIGEIIALGIVPFILWAIEKRNFILISVGYALLITGHNSLALIFIPLIFIYHTLKEKLQKSFLTLLFGFGLSAFFWIPALYDKQFTIFDFVKVSDYSKYFVQGDSLILAGLITAVALVFSLIFLNTKNLNFRFFFFVSLSSLFLATPLSDFIWKIFLLEKVIQFPFRFLSVTILGVSFLLSYIIFHYKGKIKNFFIIFLISLIFVSAKDFLVPQNSQNYPDSFYSTNQDSTTVKNEYMTIWLKAVPVKMYSSKIESLNGEEKINLRYLSANEIKFDTFLASNRSLRINTLYFPGWNAYVNGRKSNIIYNDGLITLNLNEGNNDVLIKFEETKERIIADFISIISFLVLLSLFFKKYVKTSKA